MAKGQKTGGRTQGTPNRLTKELRAILKNVLAKELEKVPDTLNKLEPKDRLEVVIKLIPYVLPKIEPITMSDGEYHPIDKELLKEQIELLESL